jgi:hypothetical protein
MINVEGNLYRNDNSYDDLENYEPEEKYKISSSRRLIGGFDVNHHDSTPLMKIIFPLATFQKKEDAELFVRAKQNDN